MGTIEFHEFRSRYDEDMAENIMSHVLKRNVSMVVIYNEKEYYTHLLRYDLEADLPYMVLDLLMPREGNQLAQKKTDVNVKISFVHKGILYHIRCKTILWKLEKDNNKDAVFGTPFLDVKIATESFTGKPSNVSPLWINLPLFKEELRLVVSAISIKGFIFEDRLVADTLPAVSKLDRAHLELSDEYKFVVPGEFKAGGGHKVEFLFRDVPEKEQKIIEKYLETLYAEHANVRTENKDKVSVKMKRAELAQKIKILFLSQDQPYADRLKEVFLKKDIHFVREMTTDVFYKKALELKWQVVLIDANFNNLDQWELMRGLQNQFSEIKRDLPPVAILSDDLSEDFVVYAQYCGIKHVFVRKSFFDTVYTDIGGITGHSELFERQDDKEQRVLIIDDDQNVTFTLDHALNQIGYKAVIAQKGSDGVRIARQIKPICIVLEIAIRSGDGIEACRVLKKLPFTRDIPILVLTASRDEQDKQAAGQFKVDGYLQKPIENKILVDQIVKIISEKKKY